MAIKFKQLTATDWPLERVRWHDVNRKYKKYPGRVMFPSSHDITPTNLDACMTVLRKLLAAGNEVLIVSKPHLKCIQEICDEFESYRNLFEMVDDLHRYKMVFRFTIGACDDQILSYWEPNAPGYDERKECLIYAQKARFRTSVSVEPMLDSANIDTLIGELLPYVTHSIWIGTMNHLGRFGKGANMVLQQAIEKIRLGQTDDIIQAIYDRHKTNPKIKWKAEIKKVVGIPLVSAAGMDI
jgi:hypothetical protein